MTQTVLEKLPQEIERDGTRYTLRAMTAEDRDAVLAFARALPRHDLLFVNRDITQEKVVSAWVEAIEAGDMVTLLALDGETVKGCAALIRDPLSWSPHLGELRVLVAEDTRHIGLGRELIRLCFGVALDLGLKKIDAQMTIDQKGAIAIFEELGFRGEALLKDHVMDADGTLHDIVVLACNVDQATAQIEAFGMAEA